MAQFDIKKLTTLDKVVAGCSVVAIIALFLPWYGASDGGYSASVSGFSAGFFGWFGALLIIAAGVYLVLIRSGEKLTVMSMPPGRLVLILSALGAICVIIRWVTLPSGAFVSGGITYGSYGPSIGIYLTIALGVVQAVCSFKEPGSHDSKAA